MNDNSRCGSQVITVAVDVVVIPSNIMQIIVVVIVADFVSVRIVSKNCFLVSAANVYAINITTTTVFVCIRVAIAAHKAAGRSCGKDSARHTIYRFRC